MQNREGSGKYSPRCSRGGAVDTPRSKYDIGEGHQEATDRFWVWPTYQTVVQPDGNCQATVIKELVSVMSKRYRLVFHCDFLAPVMMFTASYTIQTSGSRSPLDFYPGLMHQIMALKLTEPTVSELFNLFQPADSRIQWTPSWTVHGPTLPNHQQISYCSNK